MLRLISSSASELLSKGRYNFMARATNSSLFRYTPIFATLSPLFSPLITESNLPVGICFSASSAAVSVLGTLELVDVQAVSNVYLNSGKTSGKRLPRGCLPTAAA